MHFKQESAHFRVRFCDPAGIRTQDPYIKSVLLYQLSYRIIFYLLLQFSKFCSLGLAVAFSVIAMQK
jgi:hypothetical protein